MLRQAARRALLAAQQHQQRSGMSTTVAAAAVAGAARRLALGVPALGLGTFAAVTDEPHKVAYRAAMIPVRLGRDVWAAASMLAGELWARDARVQRGLGGGSLGSPVSAVASMLLLPALFRQHPDYAWTLHGLEGEAREEAKKGCHQRGADRLLAVCFANGGIYIKLGQHIGMLVRSREGTAAAVSDKADVRQYGLRLEEAVRGEAQARGYPGQLSCLLKQALGPPGSCTQDHLLPSEYVQTMRDNMLDRCPVSTYEQARARLGVAAVHFRRWAAAHHAAAATTPHGQATHAACLGRLQVRQTIQEDFGRPVEQLFARFGAEPIASAR